jgi:excisionase family DNA binding protein
MSIEPDSALELLTIAEVAKWLKISASGVRRLQQGRHLPFIKVGGSVRFSRRDIASYLETRRVGSIGHKMYGSTKN